MNFRKLVAQANNSIFEAFKEASPVLYSFGEAEPAAIRAVFSTESVAVDVGGQVAITADSVPYLQVLSADIAPLLPAKGDKVQFEGKLYEVGEVMQDGYSAFKLQLLEAHEQEN